MKKTFKNSLILFTLLNFLFSSCSKESPKTSEDQKIFADENLVDLASAKQIAEYIHIENPNSRQLPNTKKEIENTLEVPDKNNKTAYYIINYTRRRICNFSSR